MLRGDIINTIYLKTLGRVTINDMNSESIALKEIPGKRIKNDYINLNRISKDEYNQIDLSVKDIFDSIRIRNIDYMCHFTSIENLPSIFNKGFIPRNYLYNKDFTNNFHQDFINARVPSDINDLRRLDKLYNATCFSISCINAPLLKEYKKRYKDRIYCILKIDINLLLRMYLIRQVYFFYHNASSGIFNNNKEMYKKGQAFNKMFYDNIRINTSSYENVISRNFDAKFTTSIQADVMINGFLNHNNIVEVIFASKEDFDKAINNPLLSINNKNKLKCISKINNEPFIKSRANF